MKSSDWIALVAVLLSVIGWIDSRRRINAASIAFRIETDSPQGWYRLRNVGTRSAGRVEIDPASVRDFELGAIAYSDDLTAGKSFMFKLTSSRDELPDSIVVKYGHPMFRAKSRVVPFQPIEVERKPNSK